MSVKQLKNYAEGKWVAAKDGDALYNAITGDTIYTASSAGLDFGAMMNYARTIQHEIIPIKNKRKHTSASSHPSIIFISSSLSLLF